jgi:hypothetical protein
MLDHLVRLYRQLKALARADLRSTEVHETIGEMAVLGARFLATECTRVQAVSRVPAKSYIVFRRQERVSRPVNEAIFCGDPNTLLTRLAHFTPDRLAELHVQDATALIYSVAMAFCAAIDVLKDRDKQTPATYFAIMVAHLIAVTLGVQPRTSIDVLHLEHEQVELPTDYVFDPGAGRSKIHLPVKTSTRERVIQVWAHQRVLDGVYGVGGLLGVLVVLAETKLDRQTLQVIEICLPRQWVLYQRFISQMDRIYYLDPPAAYLDLPNISVKPFGEFFRERARFTG